jgi:hypothetical protein
MAVLRVSVQWRTGEESSARSLRLRLDAVPRHGASQRLRLSAHPSTADQACPPSPTAIEDARVFCEREAQCGQEVGRHEGSELIARSDA